jgi:hypothetical protein
VIKECGEEAGIPAELAAAAVPCGAVSCSCLYKGNLKRDVMFVYDIELPESFVPKPQDGEVEDFFLWPMDKVMQVSVIGNARNNVKYLFCKSSKQYILLLVYFILFLC